MFTTVEQVAEFTGKAVDAPTVWRAQTMIELFVGRSEAEIDNANDELLLGRAVAFQAAYMVDNPEVAFDQIAVKSVGMGDYVVTMNTEWFAPFLSPWAVLACRSLSWTGTRSVHTGPVFDTPRAEPTWVTE